MSVTSSVFFFFFFNDTATTEIYTLSLHDALPISIVTMSDPFSMRERKCSSLRRNASSACARSIAVARTFATAWRKCRSEEHTSELQSQSNLVCRLLLEKKKKKKQHPLNPPSTTHY